MGSFLSWIAGRYEDLQQRFRGQVQAIRSQGRGHEINARMPGAMAEFQASFEVFLEFALEINAIEKVERDNLAERMMLALNELSARQANYHQATDPAARFLKSASRSAIVGKGTRLQSRGKGSTRAGNMRMEAQKKRPGLGSPGTRIGWLAGPNLYLNPAASYEVAQQMAGSKRLTVSEQTLRHRMRERNLLASVDAGRQMLLVRRTLEGCPRQVLHLRAGDLLS